MSLLSSDSLVMQMVVEAAEKWKTVLELEAEKKAVYAQGHSSHFED